MEQVDAKCQAMFTALGMKNGTLFIESFYDEEGFHIYEMGYRVGGGQSSILLDRIMDVDYLKILIRFALEGTMCDRQTFDRIDPNFSQSACGLLSIVRPGKIHRIEGMERIAQLPQVVNITQYLKEGDTLPERLVGTLGQSFARFHIVTDSPEELRDVVAQISESLSVRTEDGTELLLPLYQP